MPLLSCSLVKLVLPLPGCATPSRAVDPVRRGLIQGACLAEPVVKGLNGNSSQNHDPHNAVVNTVSFFQSTIATHNQKNKRTHTITHRNTRYTPTLAQIGIGQKKVAPNLTSRPAWRWRSPRIIPNGRTCFGTRDTAQLIFFVSMESGPHT